MDGDGHADILVGAPGDDEGGTDAGAAYLVDGADVPAGNRALADVGNKVVGEPGDRLGAALDARAVDSGKTPSVLIGAPGTASGGSVTVLSERQIAATNSVSDADVRLLGREGDEAGAAVAWGRNVRGDGGPTVLVGALGTDGHGADSGAVYIVWTLDSGDQSLPEIGTRVVGERPGANAGAAVDDAGDIDGDGAHELIVGAPGHDRRGNEAGAVYVIGGGDAHAGTLAMANVTVTTMYGEAAGDRLGQTVAGDGDVDCDGYADVIAGAPHHDAGGAERGAAYLLYGGSAASSVEAANSADRETEVWPVRR